MAKQIILLIEILSIVGISIPGSIPNTTTGTIAISILDGSIEKPGKKDSEPHNSGKKLDQRCKQIESSQKNDYKDPANGLNANKIVTSYKLQLLSARTTAFHIVPNGIIRSTNNPNRAPPIAS